MIEVSLSLIGHKVKKISPKIRLHQDMNCTIAVSRLDVSFKYSDVYADLIMSICTFANYYRRQWTSENPMMTTTNGVHHVYSGRQTEFVLFLIFTEISRSLLECIPSSHEVHQRSVTTKQYAVSHWSGKKYRESVANVYSSGFSG